MLTSGVPADHPCVVGMLREFLELSPDSEQAKRLVAGLGYVVDFRELRVRLMARRPSVSGSSW